MEINKKVTTNIINDNIIEILRERANELGMDVNNYIAYLVILKAISKAMIITNEFLKSLEI